MTSREVTAPAAPGSEEWVNLITGSKIAAIMGTSRWATRYTLWHEMKRGEARHGNEDIFRVGHSFELALADLYLREREANGEEKWCDPKSN